MIAATGSGSGKTTFATGLMNILKDTSDKKTLFEIIDKEDSNFIDTTFAQYYMSLTMNVFKDRAQIVKASQIDRNYCYQILNGTKNPNKDKVISLCLAAKLTLEDSQKCLFLSNNPSLYAKNRRDAILIYSIQNKLSVQETNSILLDLKETILE